MAATTAGSMGSTPGIHLGILPKGFVLGMRYEIEQPLGMGGMGMVYRAMDRQLDVPVALKLIRAEYADNERILERFKKEITIARRVTHRNVARIYDMGESDGVRYISMEYIEGRDLAHIVQESGPLSVEQALSVLRQVGAALKEAHSVGVVHRDLKPHNIMLDAQGSAHVMDFGIAMSADMQGMTRTGALIGTPEYMSPEQAEGRKVDHRSDIYSLGVTLYEILTGETPFRGGTPWEVIRKQIGERAHSTRRTRPEVPEWLDTLVLKCLEKDPAIRYQSVGEIIADIDRQEAHLSARHYLPSRRSLTLGAVAVALVLGAAGITMWMRPKVPVAGTGGRRSVAILPFENQTGRAELDWLRTGLADNLSTDLAESKYFRTLSRERLSQIFRELGLSESEPLDATALARIGEFGGVEAVITGSFLSQGDQIRVNISVKDPATGEIFSSRVVNGRESEVLGMIDVLTRTTKQMFELTPERLQDDPDLEMATARTASVEAVSLFQKGVDLVAQGRNLEAITPLQEAVKTDPAFALAHARLAEAFMRAGYGREAEEASSRAMGLMLAQAEKLPQSDRSYIRALSGLINDRPEESIRAYEELLATDPDDPFAAFRLGEALERTGDFAEAEKRYRQAMEHDPKHAGLRFALGRTLVKGGRYEEALAVLQDALRLYGDSGSEEGQGNTLNAIGLANDSMARFDEALAHYGESEQIKRRIGDKRGLASTLNNKAGILQRQGRVQEATQITEEALALAREIGDDDLTAAMLTNLGSLREEVGDPDQMLRYYTEALELRRARKERAEQVTCLFSLARAEAALGRMTRAEELLKDAERIARDIADGEGVAQIMSEQAQLDYQRGNLGRSRERQEEAVRLWGAAGRDDGVAEARYRLAQVQEALGDGAAASRSLEQALKTYAEQGDRANEARAALSLGRLALAGGDLELARRHADKASSVASGIGNSILTAQCALLRTRIAAQSGDQRAAAAASDDVCRAAQGTRAVVPAILCGMARSLTAEKEEAITQALAASTRASDSGMEILKAEADLALALAYQRAGRSDQAAARARVALDAAKRMGLIEVSKRAAPLAGAAL